LLARNYANHAVYILHGSADDNVPVTHARHMNEILSKFHQDLVYHEQPAAGHWWDASDEAGTDCVDWLPMFSLFTRRLIPRVAEVRRVKFTTANPAISSRCYWATVEDQIKRLELSTIDLQCDPHERRITGSTVNVSRLSIDLNAFGSLQPIETTLDGEKLSATPTRGRNRVWFTRQQGKWVASAPPSASVKGPHRYGPFGQLFGNRVVFVYGTAGTHQENSWSLAKSRYDAEDLWVNGNGSVDLVADVDFDPAKEPDRNVILYGNRDTNSAWQKLLAASPIQVARKRVSIGSNALEGEDQICCFLRPRPGSNQACVGAVAVTGPGAHGFAYRLRYLRPGMDYPDFIVMRGTLDRVEAAGYFGGDWGLESGETAP
jgi:hypothetical protein